MLHLRGTEWGRKCEHRSRVCVGLDVPRHQHGLLGHQMTRRRLYPVCDAQDDKHGTTATTSIATNNSSTDMSPLGRDPSTKSTASTVVSAESESGWRALRRLWGGSSDQDEGSGSGPGMPEVRVNAGVLAKQPLFRVMYELYKDHGPIFRMKLGPKTFYIISDPSYAKHILVTSVDKYSKGILAEILEFVMGKGLVSADGEHWAVRRKAVAPALQRKFVASQVALFGSATSYGLKQIDAAATEGQTIDMETFFSRLSLDVVGKSLFDYEFDALSRDDPVVQAVYTVLFEAASRATKPVPYWKIPGATLLVPHLRANAAALDILNTTLNRLLARCKETLDAESRSFSEEDSVPSSVLQYLVAAGEDISSPQLRDDLMTLLIAGHETTAATMTWALHLLSRHPKAVADIREEVDAVLGDRLPTAEDLISLRYTTRVVQEALRLYPQPPLLFRRAEEVDVIDSTHVIPVGADIIISIWNIHYSSRLWEQPEEFRPERFGPVEGPQPSESNTDFSYMPFGGGRRKCIGEQFALMEATVALAVLLRRFDFTPDPAKEPVGMKAGATIHTSAGLHMYVSRRDLTGVPPPKPRVAADTASAATLGCPHAAAAAVAVAAETESVSGCPFAAAAAATAAKSRQHPAV